MDLQITSKQKNQPLKREEIRFEIKNSQKTPTRKETKQKIAALTNTKEELVIVQKISQTFGSQTIRGNAILYEAQKDMRKTEQKYIIKRNFPEKKEEQKQETKQAPPAPEQKTEEKKQETPKTEENKEKKE